jgi:hypothetical protein
VFSERKGKKKLFSLFCTRKTWLGFVSERKKV